MKFIPRDIIENFIVGGVMTAGISYLGTYIDSLTAAILWTFPVSIIPTIYFMRQSGRTSSYISTFVYSTAYSLLLLFASCWIMAYYIKKDNDIFAPVIKASLLWLIASAIFYYVVKHYKLESRFM